MISMLGLRERTEDSNPLSVLFDDKFLNWATIYADYLENHTPNIARRRTKKKVMSDRYDSLSEAQQSRRIAKKTDSLRIKGKLGHATEVWLKWAPEFDPSFRLYVEGEDLNRDYYLDQLSLRRDVEFRKKLKSFSERATSFYNALKGALLKKERIHTTIYDHTLALDVIKPTLSEGTEKLYAALKKRLSERINSYDHWGISNKPKTYVLLAYEGYESMDQLFAGFLEYSLENEGSFDRVASTFFRKQVDLSEKATSFMVRKLSNYMRQVDEIIELLREDLTKVVETQEEVYKEEIIDIGNQEEITLSEADKETINDDLTSENEFLYVEEIIPPPVIEEVLEEPHDFEGFEFDEDARSLNKIIQEPLPKVQKKKPDEHPISLSQILQEPLSQVQKKEPLESSD